MAKDRNRGNSAVEESQAPVSEQAVGAVAPSEQATAVAQHNYVIVYRRDHPGNRCSYGIAGVPGIVVFDKGLFAGGVAPASITMDCELALPKVDNKTAKAEEAARKAQEKADKAAKKLAESQEKAKARAEAAAEKLRKAQEKLAAATGTAGVTAATPDTPAS